MADFLILCVRKLRPKLRDLTKITQLVSCKAKVITSVLGSFPCTLAFSEELRILSLYYCLPNILTSLQ